MEVYRKGGLDIWKCIGKKDQIYWSVGVYREGGLDILEYIGKTDCEKE